MCLGIVGKGICFRTSGIEGMSLAFGNITFSSVHSLFHLHQLHNLQYSRK